MCIRAQQQGWQAQQRSADLIQSKQLFRLQRAPARGIRDLLGAENEELVELEGAQIPGNPGGLLGGLLKLEVYGAQIVVLIYFLPK